ncbi:unnamed protein product [Arctogadus glacialis]
MPGSTMRQCPHCMEKCNCGNKRCTKCGKLLELKSRQTARMKGFRARAKEWAEKTKKSRNQAKVFDHTALMMEKMKALGYFPLLMWGKYTPRTNKWSAQLQCPYELPPMAHAVLERIICLFEGMLEAWQPDNDQMGQQERTEDDQREQGEGGEVVGTEERRDEEEMETEVERGTLTDTRDEKEGEQEESEVTEKGEMEKTDDVEIENKRDAEKPMFKKKSRAANGNPAVKILAKANRKTNKEDDCPFHRLEIYPVKCVVKTRERKGCKEVLVHWLPCPSCQKTWPPSWEPQDNVTMALS